MFQTFYIGLPSYWMFLSLYMKSAWLCQLFAISSNQLGSQFRPNTFHWQILFNRYNFWQTVYLQTLFSTENAFVAHLSLLFSLCGSHCTDENRSIFITEAWVFPEFSLHVIPDILYPLWITAKKVVRTRFVMKSHCLWLITREAETCVACRQH